MKENNRPKRYDPSYLLEIDISEILQKHSENDIKQAMCTQNFYHVNPQLGKSTNRGSQHLLSILLYL